MTPTERAKRSDALYYETVSVNRRVLCDMVANREADLEGAQAENAKLRELVADVQALGCSGFDCTECPSSFIERCNDEYSGCEWASILTDRMRELGVEVDG